MAATILLISGCTAANNSDVTDSTPSTATPQVVESTAPDSMTATETEANTYSLSEVSQHNTKDDCWLVVADSVYDVTNFITDHPGGDEILKGCGKDAT